MTRPTAACMAPDVSSGVARKARNEDLTIAGALRDTDDLTGRTFRQAQGRLGPPLHGTV